MDDNVEQLCEVHVHVGTSKWREDVNISHFESPYDTCFCFFEILRVKADDVSKKKFWIYCLLWI